MERPASNAKKADWAAYVETLGYSTDGLTRAELIAVADQIEAAAGGAPVVLDVDTVDADGRRIEFHRGPALAFDLDGHPDPDTVEVMHETTGRTVDVEVDGVTVSRRSAHFGRGRWRVAYVSV